MNINTQVLAISTDSHHTHLAWTRTPRDQGGVGKLQIPLVADTAKRISASYGVLVTDEDDEMFGAALRGLFIIGEFHPPFFHLVQSDLTCNSRPCWCDPYRAD